MEPKRPMKNKVRPAALAAIATIVALGVFGSAALLLTDATALAAHPKPTPSTTPTPSPSRSNPYIKVYANILNNIEYGLTPEDVEATSDGGYIVLALTQSSGGIGVNWLVKLDSLGKPQWQKELGCFNTPPGAYALGLSVQQTSNGGYILGGGTIGCGSKSSCPALSGIQCALVDSLDSAGNPIWTYVYPAGPASSAITQIRQTSDGGYIAVGSTTDLNQNTGGLIIKLDGSGSVQWQRELGPAGSTQAYLNAVQQTSDGGYVAGGEFYTPIAGSPLTGVLAVKIDSSGNVLWQQGFNDLTSAGSPAGAEHVKSIIQTSDGGYLIAGAWGNGTFPGQCCAGALLLKLDSKGGIQWQDAYSGGVYCYFNGYSETCTDIGGVIYSVHQSADGGYLLAGNGDLELLDSVPQVPWLAKVDSSGNLLWQYFYYRVYQPTGRPLSQYFASSTVTTDGGIMALGYTENYQIGKGELYGVKTDNAGHVGSACSEVNHATPLSAINPALTYVAPSLPIQTTITPGSTSPTTTLTTSINVTSDC